jgi:hypothetical protein
MLVIDCGKHLRGCTVFLFQCFCFIKSKSQPTVALKIHHFWVTLPSFLAFWESSLCAGILNPAIPRSLSLPAEALSACGDSDCYLGVPPPLCITSRVCAVAGQLLQTSLLLHQFLECVGGQTNGSDLLLQMFIGAGDVAQW